MNTTINILLIYLFFAIPVYLFARAYKRSTGSYTIEDRMISISIGLLWWFVLAILIFSIFKKINWEKEIDW